MKTLPIEVKDGVLRLSADAWVPSHSHLAVVVVPDDPAAAGLAAWADAGGGFDFLREEPELYTDADIIPVPGNSHFRGPA
ncbi:MAG: hypothetical protein KJ072_19460 [Verrucomicrobia bacterium]|nr:hypothetical protein [Verrucomicrobiota bacterium]